MQRLKRVMVLLMVLILVLSQTAIAATNEESYAGNQLRILGILKGYEDGSLKLDNSIKRSEVAALTVRILGYEGVDVEGEKVEFKDVEEGYWGKQVIENAYKLDIIKGYPDDTFKPLGDITYAEVVTIMVNALGASEDLQGEWPQNYIDKAKALGVIPKSSNVDTNKIVNRGEMAVIVWDTLLIINR